MIIRPVRQRRPFHGHDLRRLARTFATRHRVAIHLQRRGPFRWTLTYPVSADRRISVTCETAIIRSLLNYLMSTTERGASPRGCDVLDVFLRFTGLEPDDAAEDTDDRPAAGHC